MIKGYPVMSFDIGCDCCKKELSNVVVPRYWADKKTVLLREHLKEKYGWIMPTYGEKDSKMYCPECAIDNDMLFKFIL